MTDATGRTEKEKQSQEKKAEIKILNANRERERERERVVRVGGNAIASNTHSLPHAYTRCDMRARAIH